VQRITWEVRAQFDDEEGYTSVSLMRGIQSYAEAFTTAQLWNKEHFENIHFIRKVVNRGKAKKG